MPTLEHDGSYFILKDPPAGSSIRAYGFNLSSDLKLWYTADPKVAVRYRSFATGKAIERLDKVFLNYTPWTGNVNDYVPSGLSLMEHQPGSCEFSLSRNRSYLGLAAGLGKTVVAAIISKVIGSSIYYLCPPFLVQNVEAEFRKWAPDLEVGIYGQSYIVDFHELDVLIIPDSLLINQDVLDHITRIVEGDIFPQTLIVDEAHRYKTESAQRTKVLFGYIPKASQPVRGLMELFPKQIYMSGTPMPQRPLELYPILSKVAPETIDFMNFFDYAKKYCAAYRTHFGWDFDGASNMKELQARVIAPRGKFMLRLHKDMISLPPKIEEVFVMGQNMSPRIAKMDRGLGELYNDADDVVKSLISYKAGLNSERDLHIASYRKALGLEKVRLAADYIKIILEETQDDLLVFAYHIEVIHELEKALRSLNPIVITGKTAVSQRFALVEEFQNSPKKRLLIGNYSAMGIGYNITKSNRVIFVEFSWDGSENSQAVDRSHRIGQKNTVLVQYMVYKDSNDKAMIEALLRKQKATQYI